MNEKKIKSVNILLTLKCDKSCWFCYQNEERKESSTKTLSEKEITSFIDWVIKDKYKEDRICINFQGGEPLLELNLIKKIVNKKNDFYLMNAITRSCKIKSKIINKDEKEKNLRMTLNFGHTFAHSFESTKNFSKKLNHGKAVLLGMMVASELSNKKNLLSKLTH